MSKHQKTRPAFTLVELLVVIVILSVVTIATIPIIKPALDTRRIREASRMLAAHISEAQTRAVESGRPSGIWIEKQRTGSGTSATFQPAAAFNLYLCEVPPPFSGGFANSLVTVRFSSGTATVQFPTTETNWYTLIKPGDLIRFNYSGPTYRFTNQALDSTSATVDGAEEYPPNSGSYILKRDNTLKFIIKTTNQADTAFRLPTVASSGAGWNTTYQINRQPIKLSTTPLQLPGSAAIDLFYSGVGSRLFYQLEAPSQIKALTMSPPVPPLTPAEFLDNDPNSPFDDKLNRLPIIITFNPSGGLDTVYMRGLQYKYNEPVYLLIGKREKIPFANTSPIYNPADSREAQTEKHNFRDLENLWVSINPQTGLVTTAEVTEFLTPSGGTTQDQQLYNDLSTALGRSPLPDEVVANAVTKSRQFATSAQSMGGL